MKSLKKFLVCLVVATMSVGVANAGLRFGVKAGVNVNHLSLSDTHIDDNNKAGWTAGVMTEFNLPLVGLGVDLSVMYARLNGAEDNKNFIQIPLNLKYKIGLPIVGNFLAPYIFTGPSFDFKLDKSTYDAFKTKTFQAVWNVGLGLEFVRHLQIGASYGFGINNIMDKVVSGMNGQKLHNNYWTITAAYLF